MAPVVVVVAALALAAGLYFGLERLGKPGWLPAGLRAVAWSVLGLLVLDQSCARPLETTRPVVLLDASLSMSATGGRWSEARREAARLGQVRLLGPVGPDSTPLGGHSTVASAVTAAAAAGRPVWLVTDGEIEDRAELTPEVLGQTGVKLLARAAKPDLAITRISGPDRIAVGDTLRIEVDVSGFQMADRKAVTVDVASGDTRWLSGSIALANGSGTGILEGALPKSVAPGSHLLTVSLRDAADGEPKTDRRLMALVVLPTPGIVVIASPASWESRFLYRTIGEVSALPVRGYFALDGNRWSRMGELTTVPTTEVEQAVGRADLLVQFGDLPDRFPKGQPRGRWIWAATSRAAAMADGDWYLLANGASPVAGAFVGLPVDSFPPAVSLTAITPSPGDWLGLSGQLNRRGAERPAVVGRDSAGRRQVVVAAAGLWRWSFRGGESEQAYRGWVAATTTWLLGSSDSATGRARPIRPVVQQGRPVVFERLRPDVNALRIDLKGPTGTRVDTLRFDGRGRAELSLAPGRYDYRLEGGGGATIGVEVYSDEWLPRPVVLTDHPPTASQASAREPLRDKIWLFGLVIVALSGEWWWRRRSGLR